MRPFLKKILTPEFTQAQNIYNSLRPLRVEKMINMTVNDAHVNLARH